ncbi:MAG: RNA methyltransferase substrate-binding domain-containing protein [Sphingomonadales bacterium]
MLVKSVIKDIQSLALKKYRDQTHCYLAEGPKLVNELLQHHRQQLVSLYALPTWIQTQQALLGELSVTCINETELRRISQWQTPNEVVAVVRKPTYGPAVAAGHFTLAFYITEDKSHVLHTALPAKRDSYFPFILSGPPGPCHSICISKSLASVIGEFDENLKGLEDWDYWLRAAKGGASQYIISRPLVFYRYIRFSMSRNPFAMFDSLKIVAERAPKKDERITIQSNLNDTRNFDHKSVIQHGLIRLTGVGIMQNKLEDTLDFFNKESNKSLTECSPQELEDMCSYLSFRYWYRKKDVEEVLTNIKPLFISFFLMAGLKKKMVQKSVFLIFKRHLFYKNIYRYGKLPGSVINFFLRIKYE